VKPLSVGRCAIAVSSVLAASQDVLAQVAKDPGAQALLEEIVVTAQKRAENLQSVPVSIQALDDRKLQELLVADFKVSVRLHPAATPHSAITGIRFRRLVPALGAPYELGGFDAKLLGGEESADDFRDASPVHRIQGDQHPHDFCQHDERDKAGVVRAEGFLHQPCGNRRLLGVVLR
jgi:hypothetical protein